MTVEEIMELFVDDSQEIELWDINKEETVFKGDYRDLNDNDLLYAELSSIDNIYPNNNGIITFNVEV